jgi:hypothetical protein
MKIRKTSLVTLAGLVAILAGPSLSAAKPMTFMSVVNGAQETPPNQSTALGNALLTYDPATKTLCYYISYTPPLIGGAEVLAHIHGPAAPGVPAGVIIPLPLGPGKQACVVNPAPPFVAKDLQKNLYYINIHSATPPLNSGEIRGQIMRIK